MEETRGYVNASSLSPEGVHLLVPPWITVSLLVACAISTLGLYGFSVQLARKRANITVNRDEHAAAAHHTYLLLHVASLDALTLLCLAPLELSSLSASGLWWLWTAVPRHKLWCRTVLALDAFSSTCTGYALTSFCMQATSNVEPRQHGKFTPRTRRCIKFCSVGPLTWLVAALASCPFYMYGDLVAEPGGSFRCVALLPPSTGWGGLERLLLALSHSLFSLGVPLGLMIVSATRATCRLRRGDYSTCLSKRLLRVVQAWTVAYLLCSLPRATLACFLKFEQAFAKSPTHLTPPFATAGPPALTFALSFVHFGLCTLRPGLYLFMFRMA